VWTVRTNKGDVVVDIFAGKAGEVRETTESRDAREDGVGLCASITRKSVIPQSLERPGDWGLVIMVVVTMSSY
jgi:hypothetical protein